MAVLSMIGLIYVSIFVCVAAEELHAIENKPGICFKIHTPNQPNLFPNPRRPEYSSLFESCTEWLKEDKNCLGLRTQNNEILVLHCKGQRKRNRPGCYKIINRDKREEIICQKVNRQQSNCEVVNTRTNLNIVIYCPPTRVAAVTNRVTPKRSIAHLLPHYRSF
nr:unnamed protein product [Callosobruchus analis]